MLETWDKLLLVIWIITPILITLKWTNWKSFIFATLSFYLIGALEGYILSSDSNRDALNNNIWSIFGIPASLIYIGMIFLLVLVFKKLRKPKKH